MRRVLTDATQEAVEDGDVLAMEWQWHRRSS
jgi:hypothetical protein